MSHCTRLSKCRALALGMVLFAGPSAAQFSTPVRDVENPARSPFWATLTLTINPGFVGFLNNPFATVPAGRRLVLEHASVRCSGPQNNPMTRATLNVTQRIDANNAQLRPFEIPLSPQGDDPFVGPTYAGSLATRIYSDAGLNNTSGVRIDGLRANGVGTTTCTFSISGHTIVI